MTRTLPVTIVIVSDFEAGEKTWTDEAEAVKSFANDPEAIPEKIVVVAAQADFDQSPPPQWNAAGVEVEAVACPTTESAAMKQVGAKAATTEMIALVEADCPCKPGWLAILFDRLVASERLDVVSGSTTYEPASRLHRVMSLYDRAYLLGKDGKGAVRQVSSNGALFRRAAWEAHADFDTSNPFVATNRMIRSMVAAGREMIVVPEAVQIHAFGGWPFVKDLRRNKGFQVIRMHADLIGVKAGFWRRTGFRLWAVTILFRDDVRNLFRFFRRFCEWGDLPLALTALVRVRRWEWQGTGEALSDRQVPDATGYR